MGLVGYFSLAFLIAGPFFRGAEARPSCAGGWMSYKSSCYGLVTVRQTWHEAELRCQSYGQHCHLASITDHEESAKVAKHINHHPGNIGHVWIGLHDPSRNRVWEWNDGSAVFYKAWNIGEPNHLQNVEHCVELWANSGHLLWNDGNCRSVRASLCKCRA